MEGDCDFRKNFRSERDPSEELDKSPKVPSCP